MNNSIQPAAMIALGAITILRLLRTRRRIKQAKMDLDLLSKRLEGVEG